MGTGIGGGHKHPKSKPICLHRREYSGRTKRVPRYHRRNRGRNAKNYINHGTSAPAQGAHNVPGGPQGVGKHVDAGGAQDIRGWRMDDRGNQR